MFDTDRAKVKRYMRANYQDHIDETCNVLNATALAEDAAVEFNLYEGARYDIPEWVFEMATELEIELIKRGVVNS